MIKYLTDDNCGRQVEVTYLFNQRYHQLPHDSVLKINAHFREPEHVRPVKRISQFVEDYEKVNVLLSIKKL